MSNYITGGAVIKVLTGLAVNQSLTSFIIENKQFNSYMGKQKYLSSFKNVLLNETLTAIPSMHTLQLRRASDFWNQLQNVLILVNYVFTGILLTDY